MPFTQEWLDKARQKGLAIEAEMLEAQNAHRSAIGKKPLEKLRGGWGMIIPKRPRSGHIEKQPWAWKKPSQRTRPEHD